MNKESKIILLAFLLWVVGDVATTGIGFSKGLKEQNIILAPLGFYGILILKLMFFVVAIYVAKWVKTTPLPNSRNCIYYAMVIVGILTISMNSIGIAAAETFTGTIPLEDAAIRSYDVGTTNTLGTYNWTAFYFANSSYNTLYTVQIEPDVDNVFTYAKSTAVTAFTCVSGCTGSGNVRYDATNDYIKWTSNSGLNITAGIVTLSYTTNIFADITTEFNRFTTNITVSAGTPVKFQSISPTGAIHMNYTLVDVAMAANDTYSYTSDPGFWSILITKNPLISTKYYLYMSNMTLITNEVSFNTVDLAYGNDQQNGLTVNATLASGAYTLKAIANITGGSDVSTAPSQTGNGTGGSPSGQIYYDAPIVDGCPGCQLGMQYGINASILAANYSSSTTYYIYQTKPDTIDVLNGEFITTFQGNATFSTGKIYYFPLVGTYTATLKYCDFYDTTCTNRHELFGVVIPPLGLHTMDTASVNVGGGASGIPPIGIAGIIITTDKTSYTAGENITINVSNPTAEDVYLTAYKLPPEEIYDLFKNTRVPANSNQTWHKTLASTLQAGTYYIKAHQYSTMDGITAVGINTTSFTVTVPSSTSNILYLAWNSPAYELSMTGVILAQNNFNTSTLSIIKPSGVITNYSLIPNQTLSQSIVMSEAGEWVARLNDGNTTVTANAFVNRNTDNETLTTCKGQQTYVCWDKRSYFQGDRFTIYFQLTPIDALNPFNLYPYLRVEDPYQTTVMNLSINGTWTGSGGLITSKWIGSQSGAFSSNSKTGNYQARLVVVPLIGTEYIVSTDDAWVFANTTANAIPAPDQMTEETAQTDITSLLTANIFWAFVVVTGMMVVTAIETSKNRGDPMIPSSAVGFLGIAAFTIIGWIPSWITFTLVMIVLVIFAWQRARSVNTAGE